jgi:DNA repair exonuclease SbcCD ATPase subunit
MEQALSASRAEVERCKTALTRHEKEDNDLRIAVQRLDNQVDELNDALEKDRVEDGRLETLKHSLEEAREGQKVNSNSLEESNTAMQAIMDRLRQIRRQLAEKDRNIEAQEEQVKIAENERANVEQQKRAALANKNAAFSRIEDFNQEKAQVEKNKEEVVNRIQSYIEQASIVSSRVPVGEGETPDSLDRKLDKLYKDLDRFDQQLVSITRLFIYCLTNLFVRMGASREEIAADMLKVDNAFKDAERQLNELEKIEQVDNDPLKHIFDFFARIRTLTPSLLDLQTYNQLST